ncbi:MAG: hypothetical protein COV36_00695 [Alphaproteobacteria bacterium CG11_big_fil_rev_8_21_14_0_20_44_7]|nr:MAG: hypothetical protein COV36_00695 [Alphaproteobacteria bacterium CG11_big_fil_rev_8_21_14_0_20_44_7]
MNEGFNYVHKHRLQGKKQQTLPFFQLSSGEYEYPETVDFQMSDSDCIALPYGYMVSALLDSNSTILARYNNWEIVIEGKNLKPVYRALVERKLKSVRKAFENENDSPQLKTFISNISIKDMVENVQISHESSANDNNNELDAEIEEEAKKR